MSFKLALLLGLCLVVAGAFVSGERARYDNYHVYKVIAASEAELAVLKRMEGSSDSIKFLDGIHVINRDINVVVAPHKVPDFLQIMSTNEIQNILVDKDFQAMLDANAEEETVAKTRSVSDYDWTKYHVLEDTYAWLQSLAVQYPDVVTVVEGGESYEHRSILGVKISYGSTAKPGIFVEAGFHGREWIAPATATFIINQLLTSSDESVRNIAESYDWYVFPHANPDGYVYTHTTDRVWRKNRTPYGSCFGADPNRNWDFHWNEIGAGEKECSETYAGPYPFSEAETLTLSNYIASLGDKINLYLSLHAFSQAVLFPYGHTNELPANYNDFQQVIDVTVKAIGKRYSTRYIGGGVFDVIYPAAGGSIDWAYGKAGIKMAFCYELRPSMSNILMAFRLPASQIIPTGEETLDSIVAMIGEVKSLGYFN